jgi:hypothetical protein
VGPKKIFENTKYKAMIKKGLVSLTDIIFEDSESDWQKTFSSFPSSESASSSEHVNC